MSSFRNGTGDVPGIFTTGDRVFRERPDRLGRIPQSLMPLAEGAGGGNGVDHSPTPVTKKHVVDEMRKIGCSDDEISRYMTLIRRRVDLNCFHDDHSEYISREQIEDQSESWYRHVLDAIVKFGPDETKEMIGLSLKYRFEINYSTMEIWLQEGMNGVMHRVSKVDALKQLFLDVGCDEEEAGRYVSYAGPLPSQTGFPISAGDMLEQLTRFVDELGNDETLLAIRKRLGPCKCLTTDFLNFYKARKEITKFLEGLSCTEEVIEKYAHHVDDLYAQDEMRSSLVSVSPSEPPFYKGIYAFKRMVNETILPALGPEWSVKMLSGTAEGALLPPPKNRTWIRMQIQRYRQQKTDEFLETFFYRDYISRLGFGMDAAADVVERLLVNYRGYDEVSQEIISNLNWLCEEIENKKMTPGQMDLLRQYITKDPGILENSDAVLNLLIQVAKSNDSLPGSTSPVINYSDEETFAQAVKLMVERGFRVGTAKQLIGMAYTRKMEILDNFLHTAKVRWEKYPALADLNEDGMRKLGNRVLNVFFQAGLIFDHGKSEACWSLVPTTNDASVGTENGDVAIEIVTEMLAKARSAAQN